MAVNQNINVKHCKKMSIATKSEKRCEKDAKKRARFVILKDEQTLQIAAGEINFKAHHFCEHQPLILIYALRVDVQK
jgi:hypothetical protein